MEDNDVLVELFLAQQDSEHTRAAYERGLDVFRKVVSDKPLASVTDADIISFKTSLDGYSYNTRKTRWTAVRSFYRWMVATDRLHKSPVEAVRPPKSASGVTPRIPSDDQVARMVEAMRTDDPRDIRDRAILMTLLNGLRVGEVASLDTTSISYVQEYDAHIARVFGKGRKERLVPLNPSAWEAIEKWLSVRPSGEGALFIEMWGPDGEQHGDRMTIRQIQSTVERARKRANVSGVSAHSLRHHYATRLVRAGADVFSVMRLLGHSSIMTTQVYVNLDLSDTVEASRSDPCRL